MTYAIAHSYDAVPYPGHTYAESHPVHMATIATLLGLTPPDVQGCRVLELGCANGNNLIPIAADLPGSACVGIDLSAVQVGAARALAAAFGVPNTSFTQADLREIGADFGPFDYIIAHGLFSWVPPDVQERVLTICKQNLAPDGIAYLSYNTYPGWHIAETLRNLLLYRLRGVTEPRARAQQALDLLDFLAGCSEDNFLYDNSIVVYAGLLKRKLDELGDYRETFLLHDLLEEVNAPIYFHEFAARAAKHGLQYLSEATLPNVLPREFTPDVRAQLQALSGSVVELEQYMDFMRGKMFRQTLLCHAEVPLRRALRPEALMQMFVAARAVPAADAPDINSAEPEPFRGADGATITLDHPLSKAAMVHLAAVWPVALPFNELLEAAYARLDLPAADSAQEVYLLAANLLKAYCYSPTLVVLRVAPAQVATRAGERPVARALARRQAERGLEVANAYHESIRLDSLCNTLLTLLDGTRDRAALLEALAARVADRRLPLHGAALADPAELRALLEAEVGGNLRWLANAALLTG